MIPPSKHFFVKSLKPMKAANVDLCSTAPVQPSGTRLLMLTLLLGFAAATRGQEWETIFTLPPPAVDERATLFLPPFPTPTAQLWIGINRTDRGLAILDLATDTSSVENFFDQGVYEFGFDPVSDSIYALGGGGAGGAGWNVRRSSDHGASWTVVDSLPNISRFGPRHFARDDEGNLYVSGYDSPSGDVPTTWIVRKSTDGGSVWTTVHELYDAVARKVIFVPGAKGGLFSVVRPWNAMAWTVRRSRDGGVTWPVVDSFVRPGKSTDILSITSDPQGRIYAAGFSEPDPSRWELRMSEDGGDSWKTISPPFTAQRYAYVRAMAVDASGTLFVAGGLDGWAVARRTTDGVWLDPELPFGTGFLAGSASAITIDKNGNIFVGGNTWLGGDFVTTLAIQKLAATVPPSLEMQRLDNSVVLSWPSATAGNRLESATAMGAGATWTTVATPPVVIGDEQVVTVDIGDGARFFRLSKP